MQNPLGMLLSRPFVVLRCVASAASVLYVACCMLRADLWLERQRRLRRLHGCAVDVAGRCARGHELCRRRSAHVCRSVPCSGLSFCAALCWCALLCCDALLFGFAICQV
jgi:hypothetical protein